MIKWSLSNWIKIAITRRKCLKISEFASISKQNNKCLYVHSRRNLTSQIILSLFSFLLWFLCIFVSFFMIRALAVMSSTWIPVFCAMFLVTFFRYPVSIKLVSIVVTCACVAAWIFCVFWLVIDAAYWNKQKFLWPINSQHIRIAISC